LSEKSFCSSGRLCYLLSSILFGIKLKVTASNLIDILDVNAEMANLRAVDTALHSTIAGAGAIPLLFASSAIQLQTIMKYA
jgi:hypothetical protein